MEKQNQNSKKLLEDINQIVNTEPIVVNELLITHLQDRFGRQGRIKSHIKSDDRNRKKRENEEKNKRVLGGPRFKRANYPQIFKFYDSLEKNEKVNFLSQLFLINPKAATQALSKTPTGQEKQMYDDEEKLLKKSGVIESINEVVNVRSVDNILKYYKNLNIEQQTNLLYYIRSKDYKNWMIAYNNYKKR